MEYIQTKWKKLCTVLIIIMGVGAGLLWPTYPSIGCVKMEQAIRYVGLFSGLFVAPFAYMKDEDSIRNYLTQMNKQDLVGKVDELFSFLFPQDGSILVISGYKGCVLDTQYFGVENSPANLEV